MLAAVLLLAAKLEPSALDQAVEASSSALKAIPALSCAYTMSSHGTKEDVKAEFRLWRADGGKERMEVVVDGGDIMRRIQSNGRYTMIFFPQKVYFENDVKATEDKVEDKPVDENTFTFAFSEDFTLRLKSNPPFKVLSDVKDNRDGTSVRVISFQATKTTGNGSVAGKAEFEGETGLFLGAKLEITGDNPGTMEVTRTRFEKNSPEADLFVFDSAKYPGFQKVSPPSE